MIFIHTQNKGNVENAFQETNESLVTNLLHAFKFQALPLLNYECQNTLLIKVEASKLICTDITQQ